MIEGALHYSSEEHPAKCGHDHNQQDIDQCFFSPDYAPYDQHVWQAQGRAGQQKSQGRPLAHTCTKQALKYWHFG